MVNIWQGCKRLLRSNATWCMHAMHHACALVQYLCSRLTRVACCDSPQQVKLEPVCKFELTVALLSLLCPVFGLLCRWSGRSKAPWLWTASWQLLSHCWCPSRRTLQRCEACHRLRCGLVLARTACMRVYCTGSILQGLAQRHVNKGVGMSFTR